MNFCLSLKLPFLLLIFINYGYCSDEGKSRGWGDDIEWTTLPNAKNDAKTTSKPIMVLIHQTWCGACRHLKQSFSTHRGVAELSSSFLMVNTKNDEEPEDGEFAPDGQYYPRIFFLGPDGRVRNDIYNKNGQAQYKYYYTDGDEVYAGMVKALKEIRGDDKEL